MSGEKPFCLHSAVKHYTEAQDKVVDPQTTVKNALTGLNQTYDLSNVHLKPSYNAVTGAYSYASLSDQMSASGKGLTPEQSQASAIMEFAERYSWSHFDYAHAPGYVMQSYCEIKKGRVATVPEAYFLCNFRDLKDPQPILEELKDIPLRWVKGFSLTHNCEYYYPLNWHNMIFTANGMASGNAMEETILQGLCEVIERENIFRFLVGQQEPNDLDISTLDHPLLVKVLENAKQAGIELTIKDISFELGIPTFMAYGVCSKDNGKLTYKGVGQGCNPDPQKAVIRAVSEYFESFSLMQKAQTEGEVDFRKIKPLLPARHYGFMVFYHPEMLLKAKRVVPLKKIPNLGRSDIKEEVENLVKILKKHGYEVVVIDKTCPKLQIPVARVFVPGMRNIINADNEVWYPISEVYHEAGNSAASIAAFRKTEIAQKIDFAFKYVTDSSKIFKPDYLGNINMVMGFKKNALEAFKDFDKTGKIPFEQFR